MSVCMTKGEVNRAGEVLRRGAHSGYEQALRTMQEWRSLHVVPLNSINMSMRSVTKGFEGNPLVARRLKRAQTIIQKLQATPGMELARMHDIAGARIILDDSIAVRRLVGRLNSSRIRHEVVRDYDYIKKPKPDGYRSFHRVYRFAGAGPTAAYDGRLVELQIRTRTQHAWATAVETVSTLLKQRLKRNEGASDWLQFFRHVGAAFAYIEGEAWDDTLGYSQEDLFEFVREESNRLGVKRTLNALSKALDVSRSFSHRHLYLLHLKGGTGNADSLALNIRSYRLDDFHAAEADYRRLEEFSSSDDDVVLVSAESTRGLMRAYPNYFLDTTSFLYYLERVSERARRRARRVANLEAQLTLPKLEPSTNIAVKSMPMLGVDDKVFGLRALARVLWALELARRARLGAISAGEISRLLKTYSAAPMFDTNIARFFRTHGQRKQCHGLWVEAHSSSGSKYEITGDGQRAFFALESAG